MVGPVQRAVHEVSADLPYAQVESLARRLEPQLLPWRLGSVLFALFGGLALVLAAIGLYGVLAYDVSRRNQELGIRMALGASPRQVLTLVVGHGVRVTALGLALGIVAALAGGRVLASLLYGVSWTNVAVLGLAAGVLGAVALLASYLPARRAARVDPMVALRSE